LPKIFETSGIISALIGRLIIITDFDLIKEAFNKKELSDRFQPKSWTWYRKTAIKEDGFREILCLIFCIISSNFHYIILAYFEDRKIVGPCFFGKNSEKSGFKIKCLIDINWIYYIIFQQFLNKKFFLPKNQVFSSIQKI